MFLSESKAKFLW